MAAQDKLGISRIFQFSHHSRVFRLDQRPVGAVHLVIETTGVTEIVTVAVTSPQRGGGGAAVDTLATF